MDLLAADVRRKTDSCARHADGSFSAAVKAHSLVTFRQQMRRPKSSYRRYQQPSVAKFYLTGP